MVARVRKGWLSATFLFLLLAATAIPAMAATVSVFGPKQYVRTEGNPNTFASTFKLPSNVTACRLMVSSGAGPLLANNVSVTVNGKEMVSKSLEGTSPSNLVVELKDENTVFVTLKGKPGDSVVVQVLGEQQEIPPLPTIPPLPPSLPGPIGGGPLGSSGTF